MGTYKGKKKSGNHSTLTDAGMSVVSVLQRMDDVKSISPGEIKKTASGGKRFITCVRTNMGLEILVSGDNVQKLNVHTENPDQLFESMGTHKKLNRNFTINPLRDRRSDL